MTANELAYIEGTGNAVVEYLKKKWGNPDTQYVHFELWWKKRESSVYRGGNKVRRENYGQNKLKGGNT